MVTIHFYPTGDRLSPVGDMFAVGKCGKVESLSRLVCVALLPGVNNGYV